LRAQGREGDRIVAPMPIKPRDAENAEEETRVLFKGVSVFDRSQVAPLDGVQPAPLEPPCEPVTGDSHAHLLSPLQSFTESLGFTVSFEQIPGATGGWCNAGDLGH
jgi:hypothetical protein